MKIRFTPNRMGCALVDVAAFPGAQFNLGIPEAIGDTEQQQWFNRVGGVEWRQVDDTTWETKATVPDELDYVFTLTAHDDYMDVEGTLTNTSNRTWNHSSAFNCFNCASCDPIRDHECVRHYVGLGGKPTELIEVPRVFSPRPTVQLYNVEGAPRSEELRCVSNFRATPDVVVEGWMAIVARDGKRLVATASRPTLYLFQNMEYSCIHSAPSFGTLAPGETRQALTRLYFVESDIDTWYERMRKEMA